MRNSLAMKGLVRLTTMAPRKAIMVAETLG